MIMYILTRLYCSLAPSIQLKVKMADVEQRRTEVSEVVAFVIMCVYQGYEDLSIILSGVTG